MNEDHQETEKLRALLEGLECRNIDALLTNGEVEDYRNLGETMAEKIKQLVLKSTLLSLIAPFR